MPDPTPESLADDPYDHEEGFGEIPDEVTQLIRISEEKNKLHDDLEAGTISAVEFEARLRILIASEHAIYDMPPPAA